MTMQVSKGEFDRKVKLLEQKIRETNNSLLNRLQAEHDEFIKQLEEIDITGLPADFISDYNNFKANTLRINDVFDANGQFDGSKIKPLTIETGAITVGQRSQQLSLKNVYFSINPYNNVVNSQSYYGEVTWTGGVMNHYGFGADGMTPKDYSIYVSDTTNNVGSFTLTSTGAYYIYAVFKRVTENYVSVEGISKEYFDSKNSALYYLDSGTYVSAENTDFDESITYYLSKEVDSADIDITAYILISQERIKVDGKYGSPESEYNASTIPGAGYSSGQHCFYIQIGYISEELESGNIGDNNRFYRKVDMTYGQTTINGRLITTGRIEGSTGNKPAYIDLDAGEIGGTFKLFTASNTTDEGETYVRSGISGITDYPSLWAGGSLTEATKVSEFRNAYYQYPSKPTATNIPASNVPFETPYSVHMFDYTISNGYRVFTDTRKSLLSALRDCEWTRGVYMGDNFKVPKAFIDHLGNAKFGNFYIEKDGSLTIGNVKINSNGQWDSNTLKTFIGSASIGDSTHHIYWNGSTFIQAASSFLPLAGGTMTGNIGYTGSKSTNTMITFINNTSDAYGNGIAIGGGGQTIIGGGESAATVTAQVGNAGAELMYVCNDEDVNIISNLQSGWSYRKILTWYNGYLSLLGDVTSSDAAGIYWHTRPSSAGTNGNYGIYKTAGSWSGNYQQLKLDWPTGIILDGGSSYGKSGVQVAGLLYINDYIRIGQGGNVIDGYRLSNNTFTNLHLNYYSNGNTTLNYGGGNVGIGITSPSYKLDVSGDIKSSANIRSIGAGEHYVEAQDTTSSLRCLIDCTNSQQGLWTNGYWNGSSFVSSSLWMLYRTTDGHLILGSNTETKGNFWATGGVTALQTSSSDKRLKKNIKPFNAKQIIDKLSPVEFEWNKKANKYNSNLELNKKNYGLIAQDSNGIIDNLVFDLPDGKGYKGVRYEKLIPILLQAVKEQQKEIDELKSIVKQLKNK